MGHYDESRESARRIENAAQRMITISKELHLTIAELEQAVAFAKAQAHITD